MMMLLLECLAKSILEMLNTTCYAVGMYHESWNRNLSSKVKDPELRKEMKNKLTTLVSEIDELTFEHIYDDFVQNYTKNEESKNFVEYFVKNYGGRKEKWAYCHRIGCGINVNMKLER
ncbi:uncharacterized protein TNCV_3543531 [Trichonephila clavipes]|nr:uncharacterized protein TNCV_3543531 [Trichonephila clavipes]